MATAADLVNETRSHLLAGGREEMNRLDGAVTDSATTLTLEFPVGGVQPRAVIWVELEAMFVWAVAGQVITVQRGWLGTTAAAHADDTLVEVNPLVSDFQILRAVNAEIDAYSSPVHGLYRVATVDLTYAAARNGYDLAGVTNLIDILSVEAKDVMPGDRLRINRYRLIRNQDTADFTSGYALYLYDTPMPGKTIEVAYKAPFVTLSSLATDLTTTGLPTTAYDIPPLGAAARLVAPMEARRSRIDAQPEPRQASEVPPGAARQAAGGLLALRNQRLVEEAARLQSAYPSLSRVV